jgi:GNAT superfamily N-acetyltransferase
LGNADVSADRKPVACSTLAISIREVQSSDDIAAAARIYERAGRAAFSWRPPGYFQANLLAALSKDETVWLAVFGGSAVGFLSLYREGQFVHSLYVDPDAQGLGVGSALVAHVHALVGGPLTLKLDAPNQAAIAFYEATGWRRLDGPDDSGVDEAGIRWLRYRLD